MGQRLHGPIYYMYHQGCSVIGCKVTPEECGCGPGNRDGLVLAIKSFSNAFKELKVCFAASHLIVKNAE